MLVTAGAGGIGLAIARGFVQSDAKVLVCDIDENSLRRTHDSLPGIMTAVADVSDERVSSACLRRWMSS